MRYTFTTTDEQDEAMREALTALRRVTGDREGTPTLAELRDEITPLLAAELPTIVARLIVERLDAARRDQFEQLNRDRRDIIGTMRAAFDPPPDE
jgi:hypothetical protein